MTHATFVFNPLEYAHKLEAGGMDKKLADIQAQAQFETITALVDDHAVTKVDVRDIRQDIKNLAKDLRYEMQSLQKETLVKLGSTIVVAFTLMATLIGVLQFVK